MSNKIEKIEFDAKDSILNDKDFAKKINERIKLKLNEELKPVELPEKENIMINWLIGKKDIITTITGIIVGIYQIAIFFKDFVNNPAPTFEMLITGLGTIVLGWFIGKKV